MARCSTARGKPNGPSRRAAPLVCRRHVANKVNRAFAVLLAVLLFSVSPTRAETHRIPFKIQNGHIFIPCTTDNGSYECLIDTGANKTAIDTHATTHPAFAQADTVKGVVGAKQMRQVNTVITIDGIQLGLVVVVMPMHHESQWDVIIGEDILSFFPSVTIDFKNSVIVLER